MLERIEYETLVQRAAKSAETRGRDRSEPEDDLRPSYQRDRDRIIHCKSFRRLKHKTQVFLAPEGDHYRTRLTHVLEVTQIGRTIAKSLRLNEVLTEAVGLGHDLGHSAFGHAGEAALNKLVKGGFDHYRQSVRVVEVLENDGQGLNLTIEVRDGILKHSKGEKGELLRKRPKSRALTLEGDIVRISDIIAYVNHDIDDGIRAGVLTENDIPKDIRTTLGRTGSARIDRMVRDVIQATLACDYEAIRMSPEVLEALEATGLDETTIVLFCSDHGSHFRTRNGEYKRSCHENSIRVPTVFQGPGFDRSAVVDDLVGLLDWPATLLDAAGLSVGAEMQGRSIVPLLAGRAVGWPQEVFIQISESQVGRGLRTKRWKYGVTAPGKNGGEVPSSDVYVEQYLYDLQNDPHERENLAGVVGTRTASDELAATLKRRMAEAGEAVPEIAGRPPTSA